MAVIMKRIKRTINDMDKVLLVLSLIMIGFGLLNIVTASSREAVSLEVTLYHYFYKHLTWTIMGLIFAVVIINIPTVFYKNIGILPVLLLAAYMGISLLSAEAIRGAKNWSTIAGRTFQPSEMAKVLITVVLACLYDKHYNRIKNKNVKHFDLIGKIIVVTLLIPVIVFIQKDFGTMFIQLVIFMGMFVFSPLSIREKIDTLGILFILFVFGVTAMYVGKGYLFTEAQLARFDDFLHPCHNYEDGGYQICNGIIAINDGGLFGVGIGKSKQKYSYIPEPHTDSVFSIIVEEYGLLRVTPIFIFYIWILKRIMDLAATANTIRGRYICFGVGIYIFTHIFINLGGLFAVIPLTGVPLPFLSYGGSYTISLIASLALVQRVHIETKNQKIKIK